MQYARYFCGGLILAASFWIAAVFWLLSFPPPAHLRLGLLIIAVFAYLAAVAAAFLFPSAASGSSAPKPLVVLARGSAAFVVWLGTGWVLLRAFTH